jgi:hypothetical protein
VKTTELIELVISGNLINALTGREMDTLDPHDPSSDRSHFHLVDAMPMKEMDLNFPPIYFGIFFSFLFPLRKMIELESYFFSSKNFKFFKKSGIDTQMLFV